MRVPTGEAGESRPLRGTLEGFRDWAEGKGRPPGGGVHRNVLDAIDRYQMFLSCKQSNDKEQEPFRATEDTA